MSNQYPTADTIRAAVAKYLEDLSVTFSVTGGQQITRDHGDKPWECFQWSATFKRTTTATKFDTLYYAGLGHVHERTNAQRDKHGFRYQPPKAKAPHAADVLYSLLLDANANNMSFKDWCADYGYSEDSLKALETYKACCDAAVKLSEIFNRSNLAVLRAMLEDY